MNAHKVRTAAGAALLTTTALLLTSCGLAATPAASDDAQDPVVIGTGAVPQTLDPILASDVQTDMTVAAMYDKLVDYDADGTLVPRIAEAWSYNDDATEVTITLRDDVEFHSGTALTAADVVYTLDRIAELGIGVSSFLTSYASSEAVDDTTVKVTLNATDTTFVGALAKVYIVDSALVAANEGSDSGQTWLASNDAGSGVYSLVDYTANQSAEFTVFEDSWRYDEDRPETLDYLYISDSATLRSELEAGNVDVATSLARTDLDALLGQEGLTETSLPSYVQLYFMMNTESGVTADPLVREAIQLAYDYEGHLSSVLGGHGVTATGLVAPNIACRVTTDEPTTDLERAAELIKEAGAEGATVSIAYQSIPEHTQAATLMESQLTQIGLNVEMKTVTYPEYISMISSPDTTPSIGVLWDFPYYPEIGPMLYRVYDSSFINQTNYARYSNPDVDELLRSGMTSTDADAACADFEAAQELVLDDHVAVTVSNPTVPIVTTDRVTGLEFAPTFQVMDPTQLVLAE